jgi:hypothetical protein
MTSGGHDGIPTRPHNSFVSRGSKTRKPNISDEPASAGNISKSTVKPAMRLSPGVLAK